MKKQLLFPAALLATLSLFAQPTIQNNVFPDIGDVLTLSDADTLNVKQGSAGANITWDFSALVLLSGSVPIQTQYISPVGTPYAAEFPMANIVGKINEDTAIYAYYKKESTQLSILGSASLDFLLKYTDTDIILKTPLAYNGTYQDNFASNVTTADPSGVTFYSSGSRTVTYDAYGTVKTPLGTFNNAARVKFVSTHMDSASISGFTILNESDITTYDWLVPNQPGPVVSISYISTRSETQIPGFDTLITITPTFKTVNFLSASVTGVFTAPTALSGLQLTAIGPNPAVDQLTLRLEAETGGQSLRLTITDAAGKEVESQTLRTVAGENVWTVPVDRLAAGNYFLTLTDGRGVLTKGWVKQ